ncbi:MAG: cache domain-containing protein [Ignavibacteriales bacterium]|nr:cache domain-containing protein [Ignavibacteriales bacterium]
MTLKFSTIQVLSTTLVVAVTGLCVILAGYTIITDVVVDEAQLRVQMDLNSAWTAFRDQAVQLQANLSLVSQQQLVRKALANSVHRSVTPPSLEALRLQSGLDFLTLVDTRGNVIAGSGQSGTPGKPVRRDIVVDNALRGKVTYGTVLIAPGDLRQKSVELADRAHIPIIPTERSVPTDQVVEDRGMALETAIPVLGQDDAVAGALYGGILLNRRFSLVDDIRSTVFGTESFENKPVGTVTIFLGDVRIATNVLQADSTRAIGTRVSEEVYRIVLERGERFHARAFVVNDWYLSAYDPIRNPAGDIIGILYVGLLEKKYLDFRSHFVRQFLLIGIIALVLSIGSAQYCSTRTRRPLTKLVDATRRLSSGQLDTRVNDVRGSKEALELAHALNAMADSLERHEQKLNDAATQLEQAYKEADEKNHAYLEMLGFVTHELKSPLASIVFALGSLRECMLGPLTAEQEATLKACSSSADYLNATIGNFLNLSRIEEGEIRLKLRKVNIRRDVIDHVTELLREMAVDNEMQIRCTIPSDLALVCDPDLMTSVFQNLVSNAIKYGKPGAGIFVSVTTDQASAMHTFAVYNEGEGFDTDERSRLFTKFSRFTAENYSTKSGTGLGLFVTKNIVERHGGTICADSMPGWWARFTFTLPVHMPIPDEPESEDRPHATP